MQPARRRGRPFEVEVKLDEVDHQILSLIHKNARISNAEIARKIGMVPSGVFERLRKLQEKKVILGYEAKLNPRALGLRLTAFIFVRTTDRVGSLDTAERLAEIPEVEEVHHIAGDDCYLVKMRASDAEDLGQILRRGLGAIDSVDSTRTTIVLKTLKEGGVVPVSRAHAENPS